jgi:hypothetical protein
MNNFKPLTKEELKENIIDLLKFCYERQLTNIDRALKCSAIDFENQSGPMSIPKTITIALLEESKTLCTARGTIYEKQQKKDLKNLLLFI